MVRRLRMFPRVVWGGRLRGAACGHVPQKLSIASCRESRATVRQPHTAFRIMLRRWWPHAVTDAMPYSRLATADAVHAERICACCLARLFSARSVASVCARREVCSNERSSEISSSVAFDKAR